MQDRNRLQRTDCERLTRYYEASWGTPRRHKIGTSSVGFARASCGRSSCGSDTPHHGGAQKADGDAGADPHTEFQWFLGERSVRAAETDADHREARDVPNERPDRVRLGAWNLGVGSQVTSHALQYSARRSFGDVR